MTTLAMFQPTLREGGGAAPYVLLGGFPPVQITDISQTIQAAGLAGAKVSQKLA